MISFNPFYPSSPVIKKLLAVFFFLAFLLPAFGVEELNRWSEIKVHPSRSELPFEGSVPCIVVSECRISGLLEDFSGPGKAVQRNAVFHVTISGTAVGKGWGSALLYNPADASLMIKEFRQVRGNDSKEVLLIKAGEISLSAFAPADFSATYQVIIPVEDFGDFLQFDLPVPACGIGKLELAVSTKRNLDLSSDPGGIFRSEKSSGKQSFEVDLVPLSLMKIKLKDTLASSVNAKVSYKVKQNLKTLISNDEIRTFSRVTLSDVKGSPATLELKIDGQDTITGIVGESVRSWRTVGTSPGRRNVEIELYKRLSKDIELDILLEGHAMTGGKFQVPAIYFNDSIQNQGNIEFEEVKGYSLIEESSEGCTRSGKKNNNILYSFSGKNQKLVLSLKKDPVVYDVECSSLLTSWPDSLKSVTKVKASSVSGRLDRLYLKIPEGFRTEILSGKLVSGWTLEKDLATVFLSGVEQNSDVEFQIEGYWVCSSTGGLKEDRVLTIAVPEFHEAREVSGIIGLNVIGDYIPESLSEHTGTLNRLSTSSLPGWMKDAQTAYYFNGLNVTARVKLVNPVPSLRAESVTYHEVTKLTIVSETISQIEIRDGPLFQLTYGMDEKDEVEEVSVTVSESKSEMTAYAEGNMVSETARNASAMTIYFKRPLKPSRNSSIYAKVRMIRTTRIEDVSVGEHYIVPVITLDGVKDSKGYTVFKSRTSKELRMFGAMDSIAEECNVSELPFKWFECAEGDVILRYTRPGAVRLSAIFPSPLYSCVSQTLCMVNLASANFTSRVELDLKKGELDSIQVRIPESATHLSARAAFVKECVKAEGSIWKVTFLSAIKGNNTINFDYMIPLSASSDSLVLSPPVVLGSNRNTGLLGFKTVPELQLTEGYEAMQGITRYSGTKPVSLRDVGDVYSMTGGSDPELRLLISNVKRQEKEKARIIKCSIETVIENGGTVFHTAASEVRNPGDKQYISFTLPAGSELWGVFINEKPVKSGMKKGNQYAASMLVGQGSKTFSVKVMFRQIGTAAKLFANLNNSRLNAPVFDLPVDKVEWKVFIPEGFRIVSPEGTMTLISSPVSSANQFSVVLTDSLNEFMRICEKYFSASSRILSIVFSRVIHVGSAVMVAGVLIISMFMLSTLIGWILGKIFRLGYRFQLAFSGSVTMIFIFLFFMTMTVQKSTFRQVAEGSYRRGGIASKPLQLQVRRPTSFSMKSKSNVSNEMMSRTEMDASGSSDMMPGAGESSVPGPLADGKDSGRARSGSRAKVESIRSDSDDIVSDLIQKYEKKGENAPASGEPRKEELKKVLDRASRMVQKRDYDGAMEHYRMLEGTEFEKQAETAISNLRELKKEKVAQEKTAGISAGDLENKRKIEEINSLYVDRAVAQTVVSRKDGEKGLGNSELERMIENKLDDAESQLLTLKDSADRKKVLDQIAYARQQLRTGKSPDKPSVIGKTLAVPEDKPLEDPFDGRFESAGTYSEADTDAIEEEFGYADYKSDFQESAPQTSMQGSFELASTEGGSGVALSVQKKPVAYRPMKKTEYQKIKPVKKPRPAMRPAGSSVKPDSTLTTIFNKNDLVSNGLVENQSASDSDQKQLISAVLKEKGISDARVTVYGDQVVVLTNNAGDASVLAGLKERARNKEYSSPQPKTGSDKNAYPASPVVQQQVPEEIEQGKVSPAFQKLDVSSTVNLGAIRAGRSKGALPVFVKVPKFSRPYLFTQDRPGEKGTELNFKYLPEKSMLSLISALAGIILLIIVSFQYILKKPEGDSCNES